jgi:DNA-directed RNA polymerase subunit RPC12/RpoP
MMAIYVCAGCGQEAEGVHPDPAAGDEQDEDTPPVTLQECACGHVQFVARPGYSFFTEAG